VYICIMYVYIYLFILHHTKVHSKKKADNSQRLNFGKSVCCQFLKKYFDVVAFVPPC